MHPDTRRLRALARRPELDVAEIVDHWNARLRKPGAEEAGWSLRPLQALALEEAEIVGGGLFPLGVGCGKSLLSLLLPAALGIPAADCLLLLPANLVKEHERERAKYAEFWEFEPIPVLSYEMLSRPEKFEELSKRAPKAIIADEAHALRSKDAARTSRFLKYMRGPGRGTKFVAMSASLAATSLHDWAHLAELALGDQTPLPRQWSRLDQWARALDPEHPIGATASDLAAFRVDTKTLVDVIDVGRRRAAFLAHTDDVTGLVRSDAASTAVPLVIETDDLTTPRLREVSDEVAKTYLLPCGEEIEDPLRAADKLAQMASGFYYQADWSGAPPPREWWYIRREWTSILSAEVKRRRAGLDSPALVCAAVARGELGDAALAAWAAWEAVCDEFIPKARAVWVDDAPMAASLAWAKEGENCLIWCSYQAQADWLGARGVEVVEPGDRPAARLAALSMHAHRRGLNLQAWNRNIYLSPPASAERWDQSLGRTWRAGQENAVWAGVLVGGPGGRRLGVARERARYIEDTQRVVQALNTAKFKKRG